MSSSERERDNLKIMDANVFVSRCESIADLRDHHTNPLWKQHHHEDLSIIVA